ncbi:MAG: redoxin domain-containing protein [Ignavibacteria bacterium]|nr:redoxin domain-containing protein [Ignavibacteria bacterium]
MKKNLIFTFLLYLVISNFLFAQSKSIPYFKLESITGEKISSTDLLNKGAVYINFWALWCVPCRAELKALQTIYENFKDKNINIIAINIDSPKSSSKVKSFISGMKYTFPVLLDVNQEVFQKFGGTSLPYSILIDKAGKVVKVRNSFLPGDEKEIVKDLESVLD